MIFDQLSNRNCYAGIPELKNMLDAIADIHKENMPQTKLVLEGDRAFINPGSFTTKPLAETKFEAHRMYADVHCIIEGTEEIIVSPVSQVKETEPYSKDKDVGFYTGECGTIVVLRPGDFLVCFPQDAHRVSIAPGSPAPVLKVVGKIKVGQ